MEIEIVDNKWNEFYLNSLTQNKIITMPTSYFYDNKMYFYVNAWHGGESNLFLLLEKKTPKNNWASMRWE